MTTPGHPARMDAATSQPGIRAIPPHLDAVGQQMILNMAWNGYRLMAPGGTDITAAVLAEADKVNEEYDDWLRQWRYRTALPEAEVASASRKEVGNGRVRQRTRPQA